MLEGLMWAATLLALPVTFLAPLGIGYRARSSSKPWVSRWLVVWVGAAAFAGLVAVLMQFVFLRDRPVPLELASIRLAAFPSGHAAIVGAAATVATLGRPRWFWAIAGFVALVGWSRVALGHHHPSDVLGGLFVGFGTGAVAFGAFSLAAGSNQGVRPRWAWWLWGTVSMVLFATLGAYLGLTRLPMLTTPGIDKVGHFVGWGLLSFSLVAWFARRPWPVVVAVLAGFATLEELSQGFSESRTLDLVDLVATLAGVLLLGALGGWLVQRPPKPS